MEQILQSGERTDIVRPLSRKSSGERTPIDTRTYLKTIQEDWSRTQEFKFFGRLPDVDTKVYFYDERDEIVSSYLQWIDELFHELHPEDRDPRTPPVWVHGSYVHESEYEMELYVNFGLSTNIWMPWVDNFWEWGVENWQDFRWVDNRELAHYNAPRLNQFLADVKAITLAHGGEWSMSWEDGGYPKEAFYETGINLDWVPKSMNKWERD